MPIYEFKCSNCEEISEFQLKLSDPNPETCESCGKGSLSKIISSTSFQLKGGGWYGDPETMPTGSPSQPPTLKPSHTPTRKVSTANSSLPTLTSD